MKFLNISIDECKQFLSKKKIVFFGGGSWIKNVTGTAIMEAASYFSYVIDNKAEGELSLGTVTLKIYRPNKLREESGCVIIITSPVYGYEMYSQLMEMNLSDDFICLSLPFMLFTTTKKSDYELLNRVDSLEREDKIPKIIHSFWFGSKIKPLDYQICRETWPLVLSDYKIIEWNMDNYDWHKHPFMEKAIEMEAWAFAADYARLDAIYEYGGIYLDMDVEMYKSFDGLLGNDAFFGFTHLGGIDLPVFGAQKGAPIVKKMMELYDECNIPNTKDGFTTFFQSSFIRDLLMNHGVIMNGNLQQIENMVFLPPEYFFPQDHIIFDTPTITNNTRCNHHDNFSWSFAGENKREKKIRDNRKLWDLIQSFS